MISRSRSTCLPMSTAMCGSDRLENVLSAVPESTRRRIALDQLRRCPPAPADRDPLARARDPHPDARTRPRPAGDPWVCSAINAAHLIGQTAGASRFSGEAAFAMHVGTAPLPVSSGKSTRHRLNRCGTAASTRPST